MIGEIKIIGQKEVLTISVAQVHKIKEMLVRWKEQKVNTSLVLKHKSGEWSGSISSVSWVQTKKTETKTDITADRNSRLGVVKYLEKRLKLLKLDPEQRADKMKSYLDLIFWISTGKKTNQEIMNFLKEESIKFYKKNLNRIYISPVEIIPKEKFNFREIGKSFLENHIKNEMYWSDKNETYIKNRIAILNK